jgi:hypothetical protein
MRQKAVTRYYCDFCSKGSLSRASMAKHEAHCCRNPDRACRMCTLGQLAQRSMDELIAALNTGGVEAVQQTASQCPACTLAAILVDRKQRGVNLRTLGDFDGEWVHFDYQEACKQFFASLEPDHYAC